MASHNKEAKSFQRRLWYARKRQVAQPVAEHTYLSKRWVSSIASPFWNKAWARMLQRKSSYGYEELLACARGELFGPGNAQLPLPPMLMFDRISSISEQGGQYGKGEIVAELDIKPDLWFFPCHFLGDPVMPGCLGLDALWQLLGFFLGWLGSPGKGRALSVGEVKFTDMVVPSVTKVEYVVSLKRVVQRKLTLGIADGLLKADGRALYTAQDLKVGLFTPSKA